MDLVKEDIPNKKPHKHRKFKCFVVKRIIQAFFNGKTLKELGDQYSIGRKGLLNLFERKTYRDCWTFREMGFLNADVYEKKYKEVAKANQRRSKGRGVKI